MEDPQRALAQQEAAEAEAARRLDAVLGVKGATVIKRFEAESDGQPVELIETCLPARFYTIKALEHEGKPGYELGTGSGDEMLQLAITVAEAIADGMLGLNPPATVIFADGPAVAGGGLT